jgi:hypothetical protein
MDWPKPMRLTVLIMVLAETTAVLSADTVQSRPPANSYSTPTEVFDAYRNAMDRNDWRGVLLSECEEARDRDAYSIYVGAAEQSDDPKVAAALKKYGLDRSADARIMAEYNKRYKVKHGIDIGKLKAEHAAKQDALVAESLKKARDAGELKNGPDYAVPVTIDESKLGPPLPDEDQALLRSVVVESIPDKIGFCATLQGIFAANQTLKPRIGSLERLSVNASTAEGVATVSEFAEGIHKTATRAQERFVQRVDTTKSFRFVKTTNGWLRQ